MDRASRSARQRGDARFIFLWIAFNAAYADEREFQSAAPGERAAFVDYFGRLVARDEGRRIAPGNATDVVDRRGPGARMKPSSTL